MTRLALAALALAATLAGCATPPREAPGALVLPAPPLPEEAALPAAPALPRVVVVPGPPAATFVGAPLAQIEALLGAPALVRREGAAEYRRYDVRADCRAMVLALPDGGTVLSVDTGPAVQGAPKPTFEDCTATEGFVGG